MDNKGFTLVELIGVLVILAVIAIIAVTSVSGALKNSREKLNEDMIKTIKDSTVTYAIDKLNIIACEYGVSDKTSCTRTFTVNDLITKGYFVDNGNKCNKSDIVTIIKSKDSYGSYKYDVTVDSNTCLGG